MSSPGQILLRIVFVFCVIIVFTTDYYGLFGHLFKDHSERNPAQRAPPKPTAAGYVDPNTQLDLDADIEDDTLKKLGSAKTRSQMMATIKDACLPKLICELNASAQKEKLTDSEKSLLSLIRDTSLATTAEVTKYHFAAHMGQLISGVDGNGCHNFYPTCPFPGLQVLQMMKKVRTR